MRGRASGPPPWRRSPRPPGRTARIAEGVIVAFSETETSYVRRVAVAAAMAAGALALALLLWRISQVLLVAFAAVLFAVGLDAVARLLQRVTRVPRLPALTLVLAILGGSLVGFGWVVGPRINDQLSELSTLIPSAVEQLSALVRSEAWGQALLAALPSPGAVLPPAAGILGPISGIFSTTAGAITNLALVVVTGAFIAFRPRPYINGALRLLPMARRARGEKVLQALGRALSWWLIGRLASMVAVGLLTAAGLWLVGTPLALALALIAGLLSFVPFLGPIAAAVPAILVAMTVSPVQAAYVVLVYSAVQFLEGNFITPLIQQRTVSLLPAVLLIAQLAMAVLFGLMGVFLATPLAVVIIALIQMLYVRDTLGDDIRVLGQHGGSRQ